MRLVIDGQRLTAERTGVGRCLEGLLAEWAETGWPLAETVLVARDPQGLARVPGSAGLTTRLVGEHWPGLIWETFGLGRALRPGDVLFAPANLVPWTWTGRTVAVLYDTLPWSLPHSFPWHVRLRFGWRYRLAARRADHVIVPSISSGRDVVRVHRLAPNRVTVAFPGPEPWFRPLAADAPEVVAAGRAAGLNGDAFFLFVGKRSRRRNVPALLDAFARHRGLFPAHRLIFVGPDGGTPLPGRGSGVVDLGHVAEDVLHGLYSSALALLYPSDHEGFGLPVVEALACGCPVVTWRNSALTESGGDATWYLAAARPDDLEAALDALASDPARRSELGRRGLSHVARFSRRAFADTIKGVIRQIAGESAWGPGREQNQQARDLSADDADQRRLRERNSVEE